MQTIKFNTHVDQDGMLKLELSLGFADEDVEVLVVIQPKGKSGTGTPQVAPTVYSTPSLPSTPTPSSLDIGVSSEPLHELTTPSHGEYED